MHPSAWLRRQRLSRRHLFTPLLLSLGVLVGIAIGLGEPSPWHLLRGAFDGRWLAVALLLLGASLGLRTLRLRWLAAGRLSWRAAWRVQLWWEFAGTVTPSSIGGAPAAVYFMCRERMRAGVASSVALLAVLFDQLWLATLVFALCVSAWYVPLFPLGGAFKGGAVLLLALPLGWTGLLGYLVLRPDWIPRIGQRICRLGLFRRYQELVQRELQELVVRSREFRRRPLGFFFKGYALTLLVWLTRMGVLLAVVASLVPSADWLLLFLRQALLLLGGLLIPTPGGSGGVEGLFMLLVAPLLPRAFRVPILGLWRLLTYHLLVLSGLGLLARQVRKGRTACRRAMAPLTPQVEYS
ncbi:MAG: flippase-like domain-containing protein [Bacteroidetes bacterium]|nr:flippase-like domain-containing protein [Bacteroidota bacterium]